VLFLALDLIADRQMGHAVTSQAETVNVASGGSIKGHAFYKIFLDIRIAVQQPFHFNKRNLHT
jgi:hypothetical protein